MKTRIFLSLLLFIVTPFALVGQTVADRLRELDRLRADGLISEAVYEEQWNKVVADALKAPATPDYPMNVSVPKLFTAPKVYKYELTFSGSWMSLDAGGSDVDALTVDATLGYFATPDLQVVFGLDHLSADLDGDNLDATGVSAGVDYHLRAASGNGAIVPYVGAGVSWMQVDIDGLGDEDDFAWEVRAGFKHYIGDRAVVKYQAAYQSYSDLDLDGFSVTVGIGFRF